MGLAENVADAKYARELLSLADRDTPAFWDAVKREAERHLPAAPVSHDRDAMNDQEAAKFEQERFPYGAYRHDLIADVPPNYLLFVTENDFGTRLRRYMRSRAFERRQEG
jgi:hypothetical protein